MASYIHSSCSSMHARPTALLTATSPWTHPSRSTHALAKSKAASLSPCACTQCARSRPIEPAACCTCRRLHSRYVRFQPQKMRMHGSAQPLAALPLNMLHRI